MIRTDDDGTAERVDVEIRHPDGAGPDVALDAALAVVHVERDDD